MAWKRERLSPIVRGGFAVFAVLALIGGGGIALNIKHSGDWMYVVLYAAIAIAFAYGAIAGSFPSMPQQGQEAEDRDSR